MDMDSTLFPVEFINELSKVKGVFDEVNSITMKAVRGEIPIEEALRRRLSLIGCVSEDEIEYVVSLGMEAFFDAKGHSFLSLAVKKFEVHVITHSFDFLTDRISERLSNLGFSVHFHSNKTRVTERGIEIVDLIDKGEIARGLAKDSFLIAVGDGANDIPMLREAHITISMGDTLSKLGFKTDYSSKDLESLMSILKDL